MMNLEFRGDQTIGGEVNVYIRYRVGLDAIRPLVRIAVHTQDEQIVLAALHAASRFPLKPDASGQCAVLIDDLLKHSSLKERSLRIFAEALKAQFAESPETRPAPERARFILQTLVSKPGSTRMWQSLATMPVESIGLTPKRIPGLPSLSDPDAPLWRALLLARLGDFSELAALLARRDSGLSPLFSAPRDVVIAAMSSLQPLPQPLQEQLKAAWRIENQPPSGKTWSAAAKEFREHLDGYSAQSFADWLRDRLPHSLGIDTFPTFIRDVIVEGNRRAAAHEPGFDPSHVGASLLRAVPWTVPAIELSIAELAASHLTSTRTVMSDGQIAWLLARNDPKHLIEEMATLVQRTPDRDERLRVLNLLGNAGERVDPAPVPPMAPSFDLPRPAPELLRRRRRLTSKPAPEVAENRRVHAKILREDKWHETFLAGTENILRCWIGLPQPDQGTPSDAPVQAVKIPPDGLALTAELCWDDQRDSKPLFLPPDTAARSNDCDFKIKVPADKRYIVADIVFRYRGRVFEHVQVEAYVLEPGVAEQPSQRTRVRVQHRRREILSLSDSHPVDATVICDSGNSRSLADERDTQPNLRIFGGKGGRSYDLADADAALKWMNDTLFITEKTLVRRGKGAVPMLDADDKDVLETLRAMARHGAGFYNALTEKGFQDPGERLQILNRDPDRYIPIEFVYDRGYPTDRATLCAGWHEALQSDAKSCPTCSNPISPDERRQMSVICPLGFWSLQKIIERIDSDSDDPTAANAHTPSRERRDLGPIDAALFGASHRVPENEREETWALVKKAFGEKAALANHWDEWYAAVKRSPSLLVALPHHDLHQALDYLQIGAQTLEERLGRLSRSQLTADYVNPLKSQPGPIVMMLGCRTAASTEDGYVHLTRRFQNLHTSIVLGTLGEVLGMHAAPLARELIEQLTSVTDAGMDFGTLMRRVRRRMLARGYLMSLCVVALGDGEWRLTPRTVR